jgi:acyl-CoA dehydrogenase
VLRSIFNEDHEAFRSMIRDFIESEVVPHHSEWEHEGHVPREFYLRLGELGLHGINVPEEYGGAGETSYKFNLVIAEEVARPGVSFGAYGIHVNLVRPYLLAFASEEQKQRWMPGFVSGETMGALAMTEPGTGSDLAGIATTAKLSAGPRPSSPAGCWQTGCWSSRAPPRPPPRTGAAACRSCTWTPSRRATRSARSSTRSG